MVDDQDEASALFPERVGDRLRAARLAAGLDLPDVAAKTRVPLRHLHAIEAGDYASLPGITYCVGFVKAYARAVGMDEAALASDLRIELSDLRIDQRADAIDYQIADVTRLPGKALAWTAAIIALLLVLGYWFWRSADASDPEPAPQAAGSLEAADADDNPIATTAPATPVAQPAPANEVALTAISPVWMRIYDASDKVLFEKEMAAGERYIVPADANNPQIRTGRADLLSVTIDGKSAPTLGPGERTIKNVSISAAALLARPTPVGLAPAVVPAGMNALVPSQPPPVSP